MSALKKYARNLEGKCRRRTKKTRRSKKGGGEKKCKNEKNERSKRNDKEWAQLAVPCENWWQHCTLQLCFCAHSAVHIFFFLGTFSASASASYRLIHAHLADFFFRCCRFFLASLPELNNQFNQLLLLDAAVVLNVVLLQD